MRGSAAVKVGSILGFLWKRKTDGRFKMIFSGRNIVRSFQILVGLLLITTLLSPVVESSPAVELKMLTCDWAPTPALTNPEKIPAAFEEYTGGRIKIKVETYPWEVFWEKNMLELSGGSPSYDIIAVDALQFPGVVAGGWTYDLTDWPKEQGLGPINWDVLSGPSRASLEWEGKYWGIPYFEAAIVLVVRKDLLDKYGLEVPKTWDEFLEAAKKLTLDTDGDGRIDIYGTALYAGMNESCFGADWLPRLVGGTPPRGDLDGFLFDSKGNPLFNRPEAGVKALKRMKDVLPYCPPGTLAWSYGEVSAAVTDGKIAMVVTFSDITFDFENPEVSKVAGKLLYTHLPTDPGSKVTVVSPVCYMAINKASKHPKEAYEFFRWFVNEETGYELFFEMNPIITPDLRIREKHAAEWGKVYEILEGEFYVPYHFWEKNALEVIYKIYEPLSLSLADKITVEEAIDMAATDTAKIVEVLKK